MDPPMPNEVLAATETFPTVRAFEWFLPGVVFLMSNVSRFIAKTLVTVQAPIGFLASVHPLVCNEMVTLAETFPTFGTFKRPVSCVEPLMPNEA